MHRFALIGAAGYIAPRHMKAIRDVNADLALAYDPNDSVGIIDSHFPQARFYTDFEIFQHQLNSEQEAGRPISYVSICSPNHLHEAHSAAALRSGADVICEKPLVLDPSEISVLEAIEQRTGRQVNTILQLRVHESVIALKKEVDASDRVHDLDLTYITSRGQWYHTSWKGDPRKSGGVATNIGIHFFDMLQHVFGPVKESRAHMREDNRAAGYLELEKARVRWFLSINSDDLPQHVRGRKATYRSISMDGREWEFSEGFTELHTRSYENILSGNGFGLDTVRPCVELVSDFRSKPLSQQGEIHPVAAGLLA